MRHCIATKNQILLFFFLLFLSEPKLERGRPLWPLGSAVSWEFRGRGWQTCLLQDSTNCRWFEWSIYWKPANKGVRKSVQPLMLHLERLRHTCGCPVKNTLASWGIVVKLAAREWVHKQYCWALVGCTHWANHHPAFMREVKQKC